MTWNSGSFILKDDLIINPVTNTIIGLIMRTNGSYYYFVVEVYEGPWREEVQMLVFWSVNCIFSYEYKDKRTRIQTDRLSWKHNMSLYDPKP